MKSDKSKQGISKAIGKPRVTSGLNQITSKAGSDKIPESETTATETQGGISKNDSASVFSQSKKSVSPRAQKPVSGKPQKLTNAQKVGPLNLKNRIHKGRMRQKKEGESELSNVKYLTEDGPLSFRILAFLGGIFMIIGSVLDLFDAAELSGMQELITVFLWIFGVIIITLEGRPVGIQIPCFYNCIITMFGFFKFVWGRGFFYFVGGCLQFFLFTKYDMISGVLFMILGIISIVSGYKASVKLAGLRNSISCKSDIKYLFHSFDKDRDGILNVDEFRDMMETMDQNVDYHGFVAAMSAIDVENNGRVTFNDMEQWYVEYSEEDMPPGMNLCGNSNRYDQRGVPPDYTRTNLQSPNAHLLA